MHEKIWSLSSLIMYSFKNEARLGFDQKVLKRHSLLEFYDALQPLLYMG